MREIYSSFSRFLLPKLRINYESKKLLVRLLQNKISDARKEYSLLIPSCTHLLFVHASSYGAHARLQNNGVSKKLLSQFKLQLSGTFWHFFDNYFSKQSIEIANHCPTFKKEWQNQCSQKSSASNAKDRFCKAANK